MHDAMAPQNRIQDCLQTPRGRESSGVKPDLSNEHAALQLQCAVHPVYTQFRPSLG